MLKLIVEVLKSNARRVSVVESVDQRVLIDSINGHIFILQKEGRKHFSKSIIMERLNQDIGWPVRSDSNSLRLFEQLFTVVVSKYQPSLRGRNCYSFQLKPAPNHTVQTKVLKR